jgi:hypothetical protein
MACATTALKAGRMTTCGRRDRTQASASSSEAHRPEMTSQVITTAALRDTPNAQDTNSFSLAPMALHRLLDMRRSRAQLWCTWQG